MGLVVHSFRSLLAANLPLRDFRSSTACFVTQSSNPKMHMHIDKIWAYWKLPSYAA